MNLDKISSIMSREVVTLGPKESLLSAVEKMNSNNVSCVVVVEEKKPVGILTERDIIHFISNNITLALDVTIVQSMMKNPVVSVSETTDILDAANLMVTNNLRRLVVVDGGNNISGVITQTDIIKNLSIDFFISFRKTEQIMKLEVISVGKKDTLPKAVELMAKNKISCVLVIENSKPVGIITERDVTRAIAENKASKVIEEIMTSPVFTADKNISLYDAARLMEENRLRRLIIVDSNDNVIGIVTQSDIIKNIRADYIELLKKMVEERSKALTESETKYRTLVEQSLEGIIIIQDGLIKFVNPTLLKISNYGEKEMVGENVLRFISPEDMELVLKSLNKSFVDQKVKIPLEIKMLHKNEETIYLEVLSTSIQYEGNPAILTTLRDITERKKTEAELKRLVITDDLTGLFNQRYFYAQVAREIEIVKRHGRQLSMFLADIDMFKDFNDTYGHWEGDNVLKKIGEILQKNIRMIDMAFRYGGEEFIVLLPETKYNDAIIVAERIRKAVAQTVFYPFSLDGHPDIISKTVSIGVTEFLHNDDIKSFLKRVDNAMYQAKKTGRNMVIPLM
jgi:diguanylate cyclase (GGDEF)-like protein/PAS domain S-box-containing protein